MSEKFKVSPPAKKKVLTEPIKKSENKSGEMFDALKKLKENTKRTKERAKRITEQANALKSYGDVPGVEKEVQAEKIALGKNKKREKALGKKERVRNQLAGQGATDEALLAFESAYNPEIAPKIKQILADKKLNIRKPETWETVHELLMTPSKDKLYFCATYVDAYKEHVPAVPLVSPEEKPPVQMADFSEVDLEGDNIINVDKVKAVAEGPEKREMKFDEQVLAVENPVKSVDDVYDYVEKLPGDLQEDVAVLLDESDLKNMNPYQLRNVAERINRIAEAKDKKEPLRKLRVALGAEEPSERDIRVAEKVEGKGLLGIDKKDLPQNVFGKEEPKEEKAKMAGGRTRKVKK